MAAYLKSGVENWWDMGAYYLKLSTVRSLSTVLAPELKACISASAKSAFGLARGKIRHLVLYYYLRAMLHATPSRMAFDK